jgi:hypothetical protein
VGGGANLPHRRAPVLDPPIFHKLDETIHGHVSCSFLALVVKKALEDRIAMFGRSGSWPEMIADLDSLAETEIEVPSRRRRDCYCRSITW